MSGLLSLTFGTGGTGVSVFGGLWFLVAFFILAFFLFMLVGAKASAENVIFFVLVFFLLIISNGLFDIPLEYVITPIIFIVLFLAFAAYKIFGNK